MSTIIPQWIRELPSYNRVWFRTSRTAQQQLTLIFEALSTISPGHTISPQTTVSNLYLDGTNGLDSNDGYTEESPKKTLVGIQAAIGFLNMNNITVNIADGSYEMPRYLKNSGVRYVPTTPYTVGFTYTVDALTSDANNGSVVTLGVGTDTVAADALEDAFILFNGTNGTADGMYGVITTNEADSGNQVDCRMQVFKGGTWRDPGVGDTVTLLTHNVVFVPAAGNWSGQQSLLLDGGGGSDIKFELAADKFYSFQRCSTAYYERCLFIGQRIQVFYGSDIQFRGCVSVLDGSSGNGYGAIKLAGRLNLWQNCHMHFVDVTDANNIFIEPTGSLQIREVMTMINGHIIHIAGGQLEGNVPFAANVSYTPRADNVSAASATATSAGGIIMNDDDTTVGGELAALVHGRTTATRALVGTNGAKAVVTGSTVTDGTGVMTRSMDGGSTTTDSGPLGAAALM